MNTAEDTKKNAGLVRDIIAASKIDFPADDYERNFRDALFKKGYAHIAEMDETHVRRVYEALCEMDFASPVALALRRATMDALAKSHDLKKYRNVVLPSITPPAREARK